MKVLAIIAVVTAHCGPFVLSRETMDLDKFLRVSIAAFHVPVFLMVSGYLHATAIPIGRAVLAKRWRTIVGPYVIASLVMLAGNVEWPRTLTMWPQALVLGAALGIYYYVPVWLFCVLTGWVFSRLRDRDLAIALLAVVAMTMVRQIYVHAPLGVIWSFRDPILQAWLFCYLFGWCARRFAWDEWIAANRWSAVLAIACCARWAFLPMGAPPLTRIVYSVGVAWLIAALVTKPAPAVVRWLAAETLLIYLWHLPVALVVWPRLMAWPDFVRVPTAVAIALGITVGGILVFRRLQGLLTPHSVAAASATANRIAA